MSKKANLIFNEKTKSKKRVMVLLKKAKKRLHLTWIFGIIMTFTLFILFVGMAVTAIVTGVMSGKSMYPIIFGGVSAVSFFTVILWKPYEKAFQAVIKIQQLEMILIGLEKEWESYSEIRDPHKRGYCIREATKAALMSISRLSKTQIRREAFFGRHLYHILQFYCSQ